jgi:antigen flippase
MPAIVLVRLLPGQRVAMLGVIVTIGALQALAIVVHLVRAKVAAVLLGPEGVGILGVIDPLVQLVAHVSSFSLPLTAVKFLARAQGEGPGAFAETARSFVKAVVVLGIAGALVAVPLVLHAGVLAPKLAAYRTLVVVGLLGAPLLPLKDLVTNVLAVTRALRASASLALVLAAVSTVASIAGGLVAGVFGFLAGGLVGTALVLGVTLVRLWRQLGLHLQGRARSLGAVARDNPDVVVFSLVLYAAYSTYPLTNFVSRYVVLARFGEVEAGLLQGAIGFSAALALVLGPSIALHLAPVVNRRVDTAEKARATVAFLGDLMVIASAAAMPLVLFPRWGLALLYSPAFARVSSAVFLLVVGQCLRLLAGVFQTLLIGLDDVAVCGSLVAAGQLSFGVLAWLLGRTHGAHGVAWAFLLSNLVILLLTAARTSLRHGIRIPRKLQGLMAYGLLALFLAGGLSRFCDDRETWLIAGRVAGCLLFAVSLLAFTERHRLPRLFRPAEV